MGCNCGGCNNSVGSARPNTDHCVTDIVKGIVKAQHQAVEAEEDSCFTGCDRSIADLLSPYADNRERYRHNTIPFMLTCKRSCRPFVGSGVHKVRRGEHRFFDCVESPVFRAKSFVRNSDTCVRLELLLPVQDGGGHHHDGDKDKGCCSGQGSVCNYIPKNTHNFRASGICITVDLNNFSGISCLSPITPLPARRSGRDY